MAGCNISIEPPSAGKNVQQESDSTDEAVSNTKRGRNVIVSDGPITIENGQVTFGRPEVTEEVEKKIYKSLSYFRNLADSIEKRVPGGTRGSRQSRQDFLVAKKVFVMQYDLTDADIDSILIEGDERGWK